MNVLLTNLKKVFFSFKLSPKKALLNSYQITAQNEVGLSIIALLALIAGGANVLVIKFVPQKSIENISKAMDKYNMGGIGKYFKGSYKPNLGKYFAIGLALFFIVLIITTVLSYMIKTNLFKTSDNFFVILKLSSLHLIPPVILFLIASIMASFSLLLYAAFLVLGLSSFAIYFFEHLSNISKVSKDQLCLICSVSVLLVLFIIMKLNVNYNITPAIKNVVGSFL